jgi:hypothetical protein
MALPSTACIIHCIVNTPLASSAYSVIGARLEVDGQIAGTQVGSLRVSFGPAVATLVSFSCSSR